jgi:hypothetical protein
LDKYIDDLMGVLKPGPALSNSGDDIPSGEMTVQEFRRGVRGDKADFEG